MPGQAGHDGKRPGMTEKDVIPDMIGDLIAWQDTGGQPPDQQLFTPTSCSPLAARTLRKALIHWQLRIRHKRRI